MEDRKTTMSEMLWRQLYVRAHDQLERKYGVQSIVKHREDAASIANLDAVLFWIQPIVVELLERAYEQGRDAMLPEEKEPLR
jgi:hypothetical protein